MDKTEATKIPQETPHEPVGALPEQPPTASTQAASEIIRPTGISWVTLILGLLCLGLGPSCSSFNSWTWPLTGRRPRQSSWSVPVPSW